MSWTPEKVALLRELCSRRLPWKVVGEKLGVSDKAAAAKASREGFVTPAPRRHGASPRYVKKVSRRHCLCCRKEFWSAGPHNRLCDRCRTESFDIFDSPGVTIGC